MAMEIASADGFCVNEEVVSTVKDIINDAIAIAIHNPPQICATATKTSCNQDSSRSFTWSVPFMQKVIAEGIGTYFLIFGGCASVIVNSKYDKVVTLPGIALVWGLTVMVLIYCLGHISGAHFNPAVTIAFFASKKFPWKQVPAYVSAQVLGSTLAAGTLRLIFEDEDFFTGTVPAGSNMQTFVIEFIATFFLMFIIIGVATDVRAMREFTGLAVGSTVVLDILFAGPISGASMNPARSLGPAIVWNRYQDLWIYMVSPTLGAVSGAWVCNMIRFRKREKSSLPQITQISDLKCLIAKSA